MEFRKFFKNIFGSKDKSNTGGFTILKALNSYVPFLLSDSDDIYNNMYIRSCIHTIAKHTAKLLPKIKGFKNSYVKRVEYLLTYSPNKLDKND